MDFVDALADALARWARGGGWLTAAQVFIAAFAVYILALLLVRTGKKRFLGRNTVFDVLLAFILGSVLSRAINGDAGLLPTAVAGAALILVHWGFGTWAQSTADAGRIVKGRADQIVAGGSMDEAAMKEHHVTRRDIDEAARLEGLRGVEDVEAAHFERNGRISIQPKPRRFRGSVDIDGRQVPVVLEEMR